MDKNLIMGKFARSPGLGAKRHHGVGQAPPMRDQEAKHAKKARMGDPIGKRQKKAARRRPRAERGTQPRECVGRARGKADEWKGTTGGGDQNLRMAFPVPTAGARRIPGANIRPLARKTEKKEGQKKNQRGETSDSGGGDSNRHGGGRTRGDQRRSGSRPRKAAKGGRRLEADPQ